MNVIDLVECLKNIDFDLPVYLKMRNKYDIERTALLSEIRICSDKTVVFFGEEIEQD